MQTRRIQRLATVSGAAALLIAGPSAALAQDGGLDEVEERISAQDEDSPFGGFGDDDEEPSDAQDEDSPFGGFGDDDEEPSDAQNDGGGFEALGVDDDDADGDGEDDSGVSAQFCDEVIANFGDEYAEQCHEFAESFEGDNGDDGDDPEADEDDDNPLADGAQQFCDEVIANLGEDAREQCLEFAGALGDEPENGDNGAPEDDSDDLGGEDDFGTDDDGFGTDDDATGGSGALATTGTDMGAAGVTGLGLLGLGAALLRRFRGGDAIA